MTAEKPEEHNVEPVENTGETTTKRGFSTNEKAAALIAGTLLAAATVFGVSYVRSRHANQAQRLLIADIARTKPGTAELLPKGQVCPTGGLEVEHGYNAAAATGYIDGKTEIALKVDRLYTTPGAEAGTSTIVVCGTNYGYSDVPAFSGRAIMTVATISNGVSFEVFLANG